MLAQDATKQVLPIAETANAKEIDQLMKAGATVQFFQPQRYSENLWKLQASMEEFFGDLCGASAYLTPSKA